MLQKYDPDNDAMGQSIEKVHIHRLKSVTNQFLISFFRKVKEKTFYFIVLEVWILIGIRMREKKKKLLFKRHLKHIQFRIKYNYFLLSSDDFRSDTRERESERERSGPG